MLSDGRLKFVRKGNVEKGNEKVNEVTIMELSGRPGKGCIIFIEKAEPYF